MYKEKQQRKRLITVVCTVLIHVNKLKSLTRKGVEAELKRAVVRK